MKKVGSIIGVLFFLIILSICNNVYAKTVTLEEIVEIFNKSSIVETYEKANGSIEATNDNDSILVKAVTDEKTEILEYFLEENILVIELDKDNDNVFTKAIVGAYIVDIIGQLQGYEEGDLAQTVNDKGVKSYTVEKEGYEIEEISETKAIIRIDLSKKVPLIDFSNTYIEVGDLEDLKRFISGNGSAQASRGNVKLWKSGYDDEMVIIIGEKTKLTKNTYNSIISVLEVMFNSDEVINYFKSKYPQITTEDKEFFGFKIEINPSSKDAVEKSVLKDKNYKYIKITLSKKKIMDVSDDSKAKTENNTVANINTIPKAGTELGTKNILQIIIFVSILIIAIILITNKKEKNNENIR